MWSDEDAATANAVMGGEGAPSSVVAAQETIPTVIAAMGEQGATVVPLGEAEGLRGFLVRPPRGGGTYAAYVTPSGAVLVGLLFGEDGEVVTERQLGEAKADGLLDSVPLPTPQRTSASPGVARAERAGAAPSAAGARGRAELLLDETRAASGFWIGSQGPVIHVFADPTCPFSERHVRSLKRDAAAGRLRAHVIPVGILGERGAQRAVEVAGAQDAARAWDGDAGGGVDRQVGAGRVSRNNGLLEAWRVTGVPFSVWEGAQGVRVYYGAGEASTYAADVVGG